MTARWSLSERAGADPLAIARYTIEEHGAEQAELYRDGLIAALERIADFPRMARERTEIDTPVRVQPYRSHLIVYQISPDDRLHILRFAHSREDWAGEREVTENGDFA